MAPALALLFICSLLQGALCGDFRVTMPKTIEVLSGSCVNIPCSFDISDTLKAELTSQCKALWKNHQNKVLFNSSNPQQSTIKGSLTGDLTKKDCTTTLNNMQPAHSNRYHFRLQCSDKLKHNFLLSILNISVKADPPRPTLTPSTLKVKEGASVSLVCSAPAPCWSHPPNLTWTSGLGDSRETLLEDQDKNKVKTSVVNFTASHHHHGKTIFCTATYNKQNGNSDSAVSKSLTADISYEPVTVTLIQEKEPVMEGGSVTVECAANSNPQPHKYTWLKRQKGLINKINSTERRKPFHNITRDTSLSCIAYNDIGTGKSDWLDLEVQFAPHILPTSDCTKSAAQINCSCKTAGNPSPTLQWYLDELPVNHSDKFAISYEPLNDTGFRSIIIVNQPQERAVSTVVCRSSNSLGSASQRYYVHSLSQSQDRVTLPVFITTVSTLLVLVCALLFVIRAQKTGHNPSKSQCTGDTSAVTMSQLLTSGKGNEVPNTTEEDIYVNTNTLMQADVTFPTAVSEPNITDLSTSGTDNAEEAGKSSEKKNEKDTDTIYSIVKRKPKSKRSTENSVDMHQPGSSFLEE